MEGTVTQGVAYMARNIPIINTARLTLRGMRSEDFARFAEIWASPEVVAHISGEPWPKSRSWDAFLRNAGHWQITGFGQWGVQLHGQRDLCGQAGFFFGARQLGIDFDPYPEARWVIAPDVRGRGLGLEAATAAHDWYDRIMGGHTVCKVSPEDAVSLKLAETLGYAPLRDVEIDGAPARLMARKGPPV